MKNARSESLPGWRAGLLVLGLYAMLLQVFLAGLAAPAHSLPGPEGAVLCTAGESTSPGQSPAKRHAGNDCICAALCHAGGALPEQRPALLGTQTFLDVAKICDVPPVALRAEARVHPPARAPPRSDLVLQT